LNKTIARNLGANRQIYVTQVDAEQQIRSADLEAAKLRQAAAVVAAVGERFQGKSAKGCVFGFERSGNSPYNPIQFFLVAGLGEVQACLYIASS
jgi:hypothetical protein